MLRAVVGLRAILQATFTRPWRVPKNGGAPRRDAPIKLCGAAPLILLALAGLMSCDSAAARPTWLHAAVMSARPAPSEHRHSCADTAKWLRSLVHEKVDTITWWQMSIRGVLIFFLALFLVRVARRAFQRAAPVDIILTVLIGSNLSRAFTGNAPFLPTLAATAVMVAVYWVTIFAAMHSRRVSLLIKGRHYRLVADGEIDWAAMRRQGIGEGDLYEALRASGIHELGEVEAAYLERNGSISLLRRKE